MIRRGTRVVVINDKLMKDSDLPGFTGRTGKVVDVTRSRNNIKKKLYNVVLDNSPHLKGSMPFERDELERWDEWKDHSK